MNVSHENQSFNCDTRILMRFTQFVRESMYNFSVDNIIIAIIKVAKTH